MGNETVTTEPAPILVGPIEAPVVARRRLRSELSILGVMIGMMLLFEALGWIFVGQSFIANPPRFKIMILQEAVIGSVAVGVTQVIIMGGIDLSSGSLVGMTAMISNPSRCAPGCVEALSDRSARSMISCVAALSDAAMRTR
jgi:predicted ABC-type sugar transport system permease subunit